MYTLKNDTVVIRSNLNRKKMEKNHFEKLKTQ